MTEKQLQRQRDKDEKQRLRLEAELARTETMLYYEKKYAAAGLIAGVDEAGRGPLAGPVAAAAVILPQDHPILYLNDSKKLSDKKRRELYDVIIREAYAYGIGLVSAAVINEIGIMNATYRAMREAIAGLGEQPDILLNDAVTIPDIPIVQVPIIKGDAKSGSIAAASILAKVTRDSLMEEYDAMFPGYGFAAHKGYGTAEHIAALKKYGPCPEHRRTFIRNFVGDCHE